VAKYFPMRRDKSGAKTALTRPCFEIALPVGAVRDEAVVAMLVAGHLFGLDVGYKKAGLSDGLAAAIQTCMLQ
jgi:hypothetical protein